MVHVNRGREPAKAGHIKQMKMDKTNQIRSVLIIYLIVTFVIWIVSKIQYVGIFRQDIYSPFIPILLWIFCSRKRIEKLENRIKTNFLLVFLCSVVVLASTIFLINLPQYSFNEAKEIVLEKVSQEYSQVTVVDEKPFTMKATERLNYSITSGYLIKLEVDKGVEMAYVFNPTNGMYKVLN